ncbi:nicotinate-nucleotide adenylyltransferase [Acidobacteria bacterium AH-259-D05]|nr:nicotinate-nucleotide adenylyltransferase [Acidobacteria bacterium AH-259-D05]
MKIGVLGGTFDPIHRGHTYLARAGLKVFGLSRVLFVVSHHPSHKEKQATTRPFHRYAMVVRDLIEDEHLLPSHWELDQQKPSYTIETLRHFTSSDPDSEYCFLAGSDSLKEIHLWKDYDRLLEEHCFIFVQRPEFNVDLNDLQISGSLKDKIQTVCEKDRPTIQPGQSFLIPLNAPPISASSIRKTIASGQQPSSDIISPAVLRYIKKHRLYETNQDCSEKSL